MEWGIILPAAIGIVVILFPVAFVGYVSVGGIYATRLHRKKVKLLEEALQDRICSIDADCPTGYVCLEGRCIPQE